jgi:hypothetical protein
MRLLGWVAAVVCVMALCGVARAQIAADEFGIERLRINTDGRGLLGVDSAYVGDHLDYSAGLSLGFAHDPLVIYDENMTAVDPLVAQRFSTDLVGSLSLWDRAELGVGATIVGYQSGTGGLTLDSLPKAGLGDFRLVPKMQLGHRGDVFYAVLATLTVPGGSAGGWLREAGLTFAPAVVMSGSRDRLRGDLNLGYCLRPRTDVAGLVSDDEAFARVAAGYRFVRRTEAFWSTTLAMPIVDANKNQIALEMFAGISQLVTSGRKLMPATSMINVSVFAAGGVGLDNGYGTPDWRALAGVTVARMTIPPPPKTRQWSDVEGPDFKLPEVEKPVPIPTGKLTGTVTSTTGQPIPNASVSVAGTQLTTDDNGHFESSFVVGTYDVVATVDGYEQGTAQVSLNPDAPSDVVVTLQRKVRSGQLRGQVLSYGGQPVLGATVTVGDKTVTSDSEGNYSLDLPAGTFEVKIEAAGFQPQKRKITIKLDAVTVLNADLRGGK